MDIKIIQKDIGYPEIQVDTLQEVSRFGVDYLQKKVKYHFIIPHFIATAINRFALWS